MNRKIFLTLVAGVSLAVSLQAADYRWVSAAPDKNFLTAANWSPAVNPVQAPAPTPPVINEFMVRNFSTAGAAIINSDITIASGAINAGGDYGSTVGVINILSGNITCNRIQSGMRNTAGIINIYDGAINLVGMPSMIETTGALRIYYGGAINFYGGTIEMDYALYVSTNCTLNMFNVGAYAKAPNAAHAPIFANLGLDDSSLKVENGMLNLSLATGLNLEVGHVI